MNGESRFPSQLTVGGSGDATAYDLVQDQILIQVAEGADENELASFLRGKQFESEEPLAHLWRANATLEPAGLRWLTLPPEHPSIESAENTLFTQADIVDVKPVYYEAAVGPESAATPMLDTLVIGVVEGQEAKAIDYLEELGLEHNVLASELLAPYQLFRVPVATRQALAGEGRDVIQSASGAPGVISVEHDWLKLETYQFAPNDLYYRYQWNMAQIDGPLAWDVETGAADVRLVIIDSGFDLRHPDLSFAPNSLEFPTHFNAEEALEGGLPPYNAGPCGPPHGTAVAGIAAATFNNDVGITGLAGGCRIMPVCLGALPTATRIALGLLWAADHGAHVANMSFSTVATSLATYAVDYAAGKGVVLCAAAGNGGGVDASARIGFPANHQDTIAVGASDEADKRLRPLPSNPWWGSQFGEELDVVAPGVNIWTTDELGAAGYNAGGNYFGHYYGTSAATALVSGLAALIRSANRALTRQQVGDIIKSTCDKIGPSLYAFAQDTAHPHGLWNEEVGYGRVNAGRALTAAAARPQSVGVAPDGDFVVVWADDSSEIRARGFTRDGVASFGPLTVNKIASGQQLKPVVAVDSLGRFIVVWEDDKDGNGYYQIMARGFEANGNEWFPDMTINRDPIGQQLRPAVAMAHDGSFVVVWQDDRDRDGKFDIMARGFRPGGVERFSEITVTATSSGQHLIPAAAMAGDGSFVVVWQDDKEEDGNYQIMAHGFNAIGEKWFADMIVSGDSPGRRLQPTVAIDSSKSFLVAWQEDRGEDGNYEIMARGFRHDLTERIPEMVVNLEEAGQQLKPALAMAADGDFVVAWQDDSDRNGISGIMLRGFDAQGNASFADNTIEITGTDQKLEPAVSMDTNGRFVVTWQDEGDVELSFRPFARGFEPDGRLLFGDIDVMGP